MGKTYKWNKRDLITQFFKLKNEMKNTYFSEDQKLMQEYYLESLSEMIKPRILLPNHPYLFLTNKALKKHIEHVIKNYSTEYQNEIIKRTVETTLLNNDIEDDIFFNKTITIDNQINLIKKYFSKTPELIQAHNKLFDRSLHLLDITQKLDDNSFLHTKTNGYISNKNNQTILDFNVLCHEVGHYDEFITTNGIIDKKIHAHDMIKINNYTEIYSIFYELISTFILKEEGYINDKEMLYSFEYIREDNVDNIEYYLCAKDVLNGLNTYNMKYIKRLPLSLSDLSMYYYSYIIAVILFERYLVDPEKSFYQLNYLIKNITPNNEKKLLKYCDIDLFEAKEIKKHMEKIKKRNN